MYGTQAMLMILSRIFTFENDVKMYGTQAVTLCDCQFFRFENDVKMYGTWSYVKIQYKLK